MEAPALTPFTYLAGSLTIIPSLTHQVEDNDHPSQPPSLFSLFFFIPSSDNNINENASLPQLVHHRTPQLTPFNLPQLCFRWPWRVEHRCQKAESRNTTGSCPEIRHGAPQLLPSSQKHPYNPLARQCHQQRLSIPCATLDHLRQSSVTGGRPRPRGLISPPATSPEGPMNRPGHARWPDSSSAGA